MGQFSVGGNKLYAFSKADAFEADHVAEEVLSLDQETFWDLDVVRELLFLLVDRWEEFSQESRNQLTDRILSGSDRLSHWSDEEFPRLRDGFAARYARYLELHGCELTAGRSDRLSVLKDSGTLSRSRSPLFAGFSLSYGLM